MDRYLPSSLFSLNSLLLPIPLPFLFSLFFHLSISHPASFLHPPITLSLSIIFFSCLLIPFLPLFPSSFLSPFTFLPNYCLSLPLSLPLLFIRLLSPPSFSLISIPPSLSLCIWRGTFERERENQRRRLKGRGGSL